MYYFMEDVMLNDNEYFKKMFDLGFTFDENTHRFFKDGMAFWGNIDESVNSVGELLTETNRWGNLTFGAEELLRFKAQGAIFEIGDGGIDLDGKMSSKALYFKNYLDLLNTKNSNKRK